MTELKQPTGPVRWPHFQRIVNELCSTLERVSAALQQQNQRIKELQQQQPGMLATEHRAGTYAEGSHVVKHGQLWVALRATNQAPPGDDWNQLHAGTIVYRRLP